MSDDEFFEQKAEELIGISSELLALAELTKASRSSSYQIPQDSLYGLGITLGRISLQIQSITEEVTDTKKES